MIKDKITKIFEFLNRPLPDLIGSVIFFLIIVTCFAPDIHFFNAIHTSNYANRCASAGFGLSLILVFGIVVFYKFMDYIFSRKHDDVETEDIEECEEIK